MPQVLEAPELRDEIREPIAVDYDSVYVTAEPTPRPISWLRALVSAFTRSSPQHMSTCAKTKTTHEDALDRICRIDPYLYIRAMSG